MIISLTMLCRSKHHWAGAALVAMAGIAACSGRPGPGTEPAPTPAPSHAGPILTPQRSGTASRLQAVSAATDMVVWASGVNGTWTMTTDGGATWRSGVVPGAATLEFRDVEAMSADEAYLLASGTGTDSRIYRTEDGGRHWTLQFTNPAPAGFYDCFAFFHDSIGPRGAIVMGDAVDGRLPVLRTGDGQRWSNIGARLPAAESGEGAFAASGTCVAAAGRAHVWIATGAGAHARVLASADAGDTWTAHATPLPQGTSTSGAFSVAFRDEQHGIVGGGDLASAEAGSRNIARSSDGGATWSLVEGTPFPGAAFGLSYVPCLEATVVATGPGGAAWSSDEGSTWQPLEGVDGYWAVTFASPSAGWLVGTEGRILRVRFTSVSDPGASPNRARRDSCAAPPPDSSRGAARSRR